MCRTLSCVYKLAEQNACIGLKPDSFLDTAREHHDADGTTEALGGQVLGELCADSATVSVSAGDLTPDAAVLGASLLRLSLVDVSDLLTHVEVSILLSGDTLDLNQRVVGMLIPHGSLVTKDDALSVESDRSSLSHTVHY